jgi:hypothetical protein
MPKYIDGVKALTKYCRFTNVASAGQQGKKTTNKLSFFGDIH